MPKPNVRNYTSTVPAAKSQSNVEQLLVKAGATTVSKFYHPDTQQCDGFLFQLKVNNVLMTFKLPTNVEAVYTHFVRRAGPLDSRRRTALRGQAERTAWKTLHEWVQMQLDMIAMSQVDMLQVLLPYQYDQSSGTTLYERVLGSNFKLLTA